MKLLQLGKFWSPYHGGIERVVKNLSRGLAAKGNQVQVFVTGSENRTISEEKNLEVVQIKSKGQVFSQPISFLPQIQKADVLHIHLPNPFWAFQCRNIEMPMVATIHADLSESVMKSRLNDFFQSAVIERSNKILFTSERNLDNITRGWSQKSVGKCQVVSLGLEAPGKFERQDLDFILFVGRWVSYKGLSLLLEACSELPYRLVLAGSGPETKKLENQIRSLNMETRCQLIFDPAESELEHLYQTCSVLVLPSLDRREGFGLTLIEAGFRQKPFIVADLATGVQDILCGGGGLAFAARDKLQLRDRLQTLMRDPQLRGHLGLRGQQHSEAQFSVKKMVSKHEEIYTSFSK